MNEVSADATTAGRALRYTIVSAVAALANQLCFSVILHLGTLAPGPATGAAAVVVTGPTFLALTRWVWRVRRPAWRATRAYLSSTAANVTLASIATWFAARHLQRSLVLHLLPVIVYAVIWVVRFATLEKLLHRIEQSRTTSLSVEE